jgi:hypothetical protein
MSDCENNRTSSQPTKQPLNHEEITMGVRKIIAHKFTERDLLDLRSYINGLLQVAGRSK